MDQTVGDAIYAALGVPGGPGSGAHRTAIAAFLVTMQWSSPLLALEDLSTSLFAVVAVVLCSVCSC
jgi:hypothetical protein